MLSSIRALSPGHACLLMLLFVASAAVAQGRPAAMSTSKAPKPPVAAAVVEPAAGDESADVLRQRLAERLTSKTEPIAPPKARSRVDERGRPAPAKPAAQIHWAYGGEGAPEHWGGLKPEYRLCAIGTRQSPIDIRDGIRVDLEPIQFDYKPSGFAVLDTGHTVQVNIAPGNFLQVMGRRFELQQFHFHRPSEERINGRQFDMVAHLVHKDAEGRLAVLAVLLERGPIHQAQAVVQTVWNNLPLEKHEAQPGPGMLDLLQLLPEDRGYYTYMGSLTTPPCSESVLWMVMRQPVQLSGEQIEIFAKLYPMNARPLQKDSGRLIKQSR
ncbi:carbonic anhydrase [Paucibacter sp. M5-1]|uniref:carbonic anhydrase n=1 Tax=Paucibacter sp. M5-1 TaxID=3015998 RepID=UPI0022B89355|nr:carbonic anhydrase family protein [Paucibacter sp. M5-1]MCZ7880698.1 carbonic anhydrase family protein [Paucibacter sp. M5-1]